MYMYINIYMYMYITGAIIFLKLIVVIYVPYLVLSHSRQ